MFKQTAVFASLLGCELSVRCKVISGCHPVLQKIMMSLFHISKGGMLNFFFWLFEKLYKKKWLNASSMCHSRCKIISSCKNEKLKVHKKMRQQEVRSSWMCVKQSLKECCSLSGWKWFCVCSLYKIRVTHTHNDSPSDKCLSIFTFNVIGHTVWYGNHQGLRELSFRRWSMTIEDKELLIKSYNNPKKADTGWSMSLLK